MALFEYQAIIKDGRLREGVIDADSLKTAKTRLMKEKILVTKIKPLSKKKGQKVCLKPSELLDFTRDLSSLLRAGLPLYESLSTLEEKMRRHRAHALFLDLTDRIKQGHSLSKILADYPKSFSRLYISMVMAGEESGSLIEVFLELVSYLSKQQKMKKQMVSALIYPLFLGSFCLLVLIGLFFFLIPSMQDLYEGRSLHPMTHFVLSISLFLRKHTLLIGCMTLTLVLSLISFFKSRKGQIFLKITWLKLPVIKKMVTESVLTRFCRSLSVLLKSDVPYLKALTLSRQVMNHPLFEKIIQEAEGKVIQGKKISEELSQSRLIPPLVSRMLAMAEETGSSSEMLGNIAMIYEEELEKSLSRFTALLQPIILLFLGLVVGIILLSVLLPLTDVSSFAM
ncbi:MAG: type II secretion system F family protein [Simkaniaceae bacterium]